MFKDKNLVITGGSSGLGLALAHKLAAQGANLALVARNPEKLEKAVAEVQAAAPGIKVIAQAADVTDEAATVAAMDHIADALGSIDALFNNAGILREGYFEKLPMSDFRDVMEINFFGQLHTTRAALPHLRASQGRLVNIASMAGLSGAFGYTPYCSAKHALVGLTSCLRYELEPQGIDVHLVCPAEFDSPLVDELEQTRTPENRAHTLTIPKTGVDVIVDGALAGIKAGKFLIVPGRTTKTVALAMRHLPGLVYRLGKKTIDKVYKGPDLAN